MTVLVGADGSVELDLGDGLICVANVFTWEAELKREMLRRTTQADEFERRTAGLGDWSGSFSFRMQFSDDIEQAQSAWQILEYAVTGSDDDLKADIDLVLQHYRRPPDYDIFNSTIAGVIKLTGTVVIGDIRLDCEDPEKPIVAVAIWQGDGPLALERSDLL